jgi:hypothetical protein
MISPTVLPAGNPEPVPVPIPAVAALRSLPRRATRDEVNR